MLEQAAADGRNDILRFLLAQRDHYVCCSSNGSTPIIQATKYRHRATIDLLLAHKEPIDECAVSGAGPALTTAIEADDLSMVKFLISRGANVNVRYKFDSVLSGAVKHPDIVRFLLRHGAQVDLPGNRPRDITPLMTAAYDGNVASINLLVASGADLDWVGYYGDTPLMMATAHGHLQAVKALLRWGADVNQRTHRYEAGEKVSITALKVAQKAGHPAVVRLLRQAGAKE